MQKLLGVSNYYGSYEGRPYNGYRIYVATDHANEKAEKILGGCRVDVLKLSKEYDITKNDPCQYIGHEIQTAYDRYGSIAFINLVK